MDGYLFLPFFDVIKSAPLLALNQRDERRKKQCTHAHSTKQTEGKRNEAKKFQPNIDDNKLVGDGSASKI